MDVLEVMTAAKIELGRRLRSLGPADWARPTPCADFSVGDLANHVVAGCVMSTGLLDGARLPDVIAALDKDTVEGDELLARWIACSEEMMRAFGAPGALERTVHHPAGDVPGSALAEMRVAELVLHGWDLARAVGAEARIEGSVAERLVTFLSPAMPAYIAAGYFRPSTHRIDDRASAEERLLHLTGRIP